MDRSGIMDRHKVRYHGQVYGEYLVVNEYYRLNNKTNFLSKHFNFFKAVQTFNSGWYPGRIMYVYEKNAPPGDIYMPAGHTYDMGHLFTYLKFSFPNSDHLQNLIDPRDNRLNETTPEVEDVFSNNTFMLPQELLVKRAIDNYIKTNS